MLRKLVLVPSNMMLRYNFSVVDWEQIPKPFNVGSTAQQKKLLLHPTLRPFPKYVGSLNDSLHIPGMEGDSLFNMYIEFVQTKETPLSPQFVGFFLYNFSKQGYLNTTTWAKIEPYIGRNRGEYSMRSIFGCLYGCIRYGSTQYIQFFVQEMIGQKVSFTDLEAVQIIEAFNLTNNTYTTEFKHDFWNKHFRDHFKSTIKEGVKIKNYKLITRIFNAFDKFQYYQDVQLWNLMISWFERKKGWKRTEIIQRLYPLTGTFEKAKEVFDNYYTELSTNENVLWRYNLQQLRFYTSEEMIAKSQNDIKMQPSDRTVVKRKDQKRFNEEYYQWLKDGARQREDQLVKDKAQSLAFAIKDRYDSMKKDNADFSKLNPQEFQDLFGVYDPEIMYRAPKQSGELEGSEQLEQQLKAEAMQQQSSKTKKKQKTKNQK